MRRAAVLLTTVVAAMIAATAVIAPPSHAATDGIDTFRVGKGPEGVTIAPDGRAAYVANADSDSVSVIDIASGATVRSLPVGGYPVALDVSPDSTTLYVASGFDDAIEAIDVRSGRVLARTAIGDSPDDLVVSPDGRRVYAVSGNAEQLSVIDAASSRRTAVIDLGGFSESIAVSPDGTRVYAVVTTRPSAVRVIDTATNTVTATWRLGDWATDIAVSPDGARAYVPTFRQSNAAGSLRVLDTATGRQVAATAAGLRPTSIATSPDGRVAYVASQGAGYASGGGSSGLVSAIDVSTGRILGSWAAEGAGTARKEIIDIAVTPDGGRVLGTLAQARVGIVVATAPVRATPGLPEAVTARVSGSRMAARWQPPAGAAGSVAYVATALPIAEGPLPARSCRTTATACTITGLMPGLRYEVHVQPRTAAGWGPTAVGRAVRTPGSAGADSVQ